jgi:hypothetical protein
MYIVVVLATAIGFNPNTHVPLGKEGSKYVANYDRDRVNKAVSIR